MVMIFEDIKINNIRAASCNFYNNGMQLIVVWTSVAPTVAYCAIFYYKQQVCIIHTISKACLNIPGQAKNARANKYDE